MQNNRLISIIDSFYIFSLRFLSIDSVSCLIDAAWWRWRRNPWIPSTWTPPIDNGWHAAGFRQMDSAVSQFRWNSHQRHLPAVSWVRDERILNVALKSDSGRRNKTELHQQSTCVQRDEWGGIVTKSSKKRRQGAITYGPAAAIHPSGDWFVRADVSPICSWIMQKKIRHNQRHLWAGRVTNAIYRQRPQLEISTENFFV